MLYIISDDVELAVAVNADGVHVGQDDMCLEDVRNIVGHKVVGISIHSIEELHKTDVLYADCVGVGPMYTTSSKPDAQEPCGPERTAELQAEGLTLPCIGIGGITIDNAMYSVLALVVLPLYLPLPMQKSLMKRFDNLKN